MPTRTRQEWFLPAGLQVLAFGWRRKKLGLSRFGIVKATNGVEFTEIKSENLHGLRVLGFGGWSECDRQPHAAQITGPSRQFLDE